jgi:hypothetical protein
MNVNIGQTMICNYLTNGIRINEDGSIVPCCALSGNMGIYYDTNFDFLKFKDSKPVVELRDQLEANIWPTSCSNCSKMEKSKHLSLRQKSLIELKNKKFVDIVLGKECNSDCVMCYAGQSSKISSRLKNHKPTFNVPDTDLYWVTNSNEKNYIENSNFWDDINKIFPTVDKFKFLGGEPFINKSFWEWLDSSTVTSLKKTKEIEIVTNGSTLHKDKLSSLEGWKNCVMTFSIDALDKEYEWIRHGLKWNTVHENLLNVKNISNIVLIVHITLSLFSVTSIAKLLEYVESNNLNFIVTPVYSPSLLALDKTPIKILQTVLDELEQIQTSNIKNQIQLKGTKKLIQDAIVNNKENSQLRQEITNYFNNHRTHKMNWLTLKCMI